VLIEICVLFEENLFKKKVGKLEIPVGTINLIEFVLFEN